MYWGDGSLDKIEMANLDGSGRVILVNESSTDSHYFAFALDSQYLYFTDWSDTGPSRYHFTVIPVNCISSAEQKDRLSKK